MKTLVNIFIISLAKCKCFLIPVANNLEYFVPIIDVRYINESIIYIKDSDLSDDEFLSSLILGLYSDQSVVLANNDGFNDAKSGTFTSDPNIILVAKSLTLDDFKSPKFSTIFGSYWSVINIILTATREHNTCENGAVSEEFFENAENYMNMIWQRYRIVRVIISFSYTCPHHFIIFSGKKPSNATLYNRTIKVIKATNKRELKAAVMENSRLLPLTEGYPLRANIFSRFPTSITTCNIDKYYVMNMNFNYSNGYCGMDGLVMHDFIEYYKYNLSNPHDESCNKYGFVVPEVHGASGSLGCVLRNQLDISFNSRFQVQYTTQEYIYLHYISQDSLCAVLKKPPIINLWHYAYNIYNVKTGTILTMLIILLGVLAWAAVWLTQEMSGQKPHSMHTYIFNSITSTLFGFQIVKSSQRFRVLNGTSLFCSIILLALYQGNVNYEFTTRMRYKEIKSLDQLFHSKYVLFTSPSIQDLMRKNINPNDKSQVEYLHKIQMKNETVGIEIVLNDLQAATISRGHDVQIEMLLNFTDDTGSPQLYVVDECFHVYYLSFIARTGFLFIEESLLFMMRMLEAGLPHKYYVWTRRTLKLGNTSKKSDTEPRPFGKTKMSHLRVAFGVLSFGYMFSTCVFVVEKYRGRHR